MSRFLTAVSVLCLPICATSAAMAQDQGLRYSGNVEAEFSSNGDSDATVLGGDLDLAYSFGAFGVELGADSDYLLDESIDFSAYFAAVTMDSPFGQVALGAPRPVNDILLTMPEFAGSRLADLELGALSARVTTPIIKSNSNFAYGARLMGENGALRYGVSIHQPSDISEVVLIQGAAQYSTGMMRFEGALEQLFVSSGEDGLNATAGVVYDGTPVSGGIYVSRQDAIFTADSLRGFVGYDVSDRLTVRGDVQWLSGGLDSTIYGAEANYGFGNGAYAQFGVLDGTNVQRVILDAAVGFAF